MISPPKQLSSSCFGERMNVEFRIPRPPREMALRKDHEGDAPFVARSDLSAYLNRLAHDWPQPPRPTSRFHTADEDARRTVTLTKAARESFDTLAAEALKPCSRPC